MFISKKNRITTYTYLFKEGTLVAKKDYFKDSHSAKLDIPNLEVIGLLRSLRSKGFVTETFNWQYYYWYLTNDGIEYLRKYLALPAEIVPDTLKAPATQSRPTGAPEERKSKGGPGGDFNPSFEGRGNRDGYRQREQRS
jgi:small subunit ribosomal protein S10e